MRVLVQPGIGVRSKKEKTIVNLLTNRSPPSSIEGRFTRDGFTNNLSRRAVTRCSKTLCIQHKKVVIFMKLPTNTIFHVILKFDCKT